MNASGLTTVTLGDSGTVKTGQKVTALGNAEGKDGTPSVATGTVTSLGNAITAEDLGLPGERPRGEPLNLRQVRDEAEYGAVVKALARSESNILRASELLGITRPTLYDLMERLAIKTPNGA